MSGTFGVFMSYCRYDGAKRALLECLGDVQEKIDANNSNEEFTPKTTDEVEAFEYMIEYFVQWLYDNNILDGEGELDNNELSNVCDMLMGKEV